MKERAYHFVPPTSHQDAFPMTFHAKSLPFFGHYKEILILTVGSVATHTGHSSTPVQRKFWWKREGWFYP